MPALDRVGQLLSERETNYQGALQAGRNDLLQREKLLNMLKIDFASNPDLIAEFDRMISQTRRARRDITSEGSYLFENDLLNNALRIKGQGNISNTVNKTGTGERSRSQPVPGTEAHHPASVSSTESLVQNMDEYEIRRLWEIARENGYTVGSQADGFIPLSKPAHTTGGRNWGSDYAHVGTDGKTPDPGRFKATAVPKGSTAEQAWPALKDMLDEQRLLNERAYSHPFEQHTRNLIEQNVGPVEWRGPVTPNRAPVKAEAKAQGINATVISKSIDRNPGLIASNLTPGVNVMTPVGAKVPPDMKMPKPLPKASRTLPAPHAQTAKAAAGVAPPPRPNLSALQIPKPALKIAGVVGAALPVLDAADAFAGTTGALDSTKSQGDRLANTLQGISGYTGLAALHPVAAPIAAPLSITAGALSAAVQRRADMDKPKPKPLQYGAAQTAQVRPLTNRSSLRPTPNVSKPNKTPIQVINNELRYFGGRLLNKLGIRK